MTKNYVARASAADDRYQLAWSGYRATRHPRDLDIDPAQARAIIAVAIRPLAAPCRRTGPASGCPGAAARRETIAVSTAALQCPPLFRPHSVQRTNMLSNFLRKRPSAGHVAAPDAPGVPTQAEGLFLPRFITLPASLDHSQKPMQSMSNVGRGGIPEGHETRAARDRVAAAQGQIEELRVKIQTCEGRRDEAATRAAALASRRNNAEATLRTAALNPDAPPVDPIELATMIGEQAIADREAARVAAVEQTEIDRLQLDLVALQTKLPNLERAIAVARFGELTALYGEAIQSVIPLAIELRAAAARVHRDTRDQPLLIDPEADYGGQLFGVAVGAIG